jgi:hypothetical protein
MIFGGAEDIDENYLKFWKKLSPQKNLSFCKEMEASIKEQKTVGIDSVLILSSRFWTNIFWVFIFEIIASQNDNFDACI